MLRRLPPTWTDWGVPAVIAALVLAEIAMVRPDGALAASVLGVASCAALVVRRRMPMVACFLAGALSLITPWFGPRLDDLSAPIFVMAVVAYSLARWVDGYAGPAVLALLMLILVSDYVFTDERDNDVTDVFFVAALLLPPYVMGKVVRRMAAQEEQLRGQQELIRQQAIRDERDRIARDLHDVIAHSVSAMVVQTAAAQDLVRTDPARAEQVLADVADTGRRALAETGRLLHVIRDSKDELGLEPAPGLAQVPQLVDRFRGDGLDVELRLDPEVPALPSGLDVSAYRIAQEALTNALRYGADARARLHIDVADDALRIHSSNRANGRTGSGSGLGLLGMMERVQLLGGTLTHGVTPEGRFELDAQLPVSS